MTPDRKRTVNGKLVTEYYWNGRLVTYVDHKSYNGTFDEAVHELLANGELAA